MKKRFIALFMSFILLFMVIPPISSSAAQNVWKLVTIDHSTLDTVSFYAEGDFVGYNGGKVAIVNSDFKLITQTDYDTVELNDYIDCLVVSKTETNKVGLINRNGEQLLPLEYSSIKLSDQYVITYKEQEDESSILNHKGERIRGPIKGKVVYNEEFDCFRLYDGSHVVGCYDINWNTADLLKTYSIFTWEQISNAMNTWIKKIPGMMKCNICYDRLIICREVNDDTLYQLYDIDGNTYGEPYSSITNVSHDFYSVKDSHNDQFVLNKDGKVLSQVYENTTLNAYSQIQQYTLYKGKETNLYDYSGNHVAVIPGDCFYIESLNMYYSIYSIPNYTQGMFDIDGSVIVPMGETPFVFKGYNKICDSEVGWEQVYIPWQDITDLPHPVETPTTPTTSPASPSTTASPVPLSPKPEQTNTPVTRPTPAPSSLPVPEVSPIALPIMANKVINVTASKIKTNSLTLTWTAQPGVTGYVIQRYDKKAKKFKTLGTVQNACYTDTKLKSGTAYQYRVYSFVTTNGPIQNGPYSDVLKTATKPKAPKISVKAYHKKIVVSHKKLKGTNGYEVSISTNKKKGFKKAATRKASKTSITIKKLKTKKTYYIKARAFKLVGKEKIYSPYSAVKKIVVK